MFFEKGTMLISTCLEYYILQHTARIILKINIGTRYVHIAVATRLNFVLVESNFPSTRHTNLCELSYSMRSLLETVGHWYL
jgi:hypothetical protein